MKKTIELYVNAIQEMSVYEIKSLIASNNSLWNEIIALHQADIVDILEQIVSLKRFILFINLPPALQADVFIECSDDFRKELFISCKQNERERLLKHLTIDELVDFFDDLSDIEVTGYIKLINKKEREAILSRLKLPKDSAGDIMDTEVFVLPEHMNVHNAISLLQKMNTNVSMNRIVYVVDKKNKLVGYIFLEEILLHKPTQSISSFTKPAQYNINVYDDKENIAQYMLHYRIEVAPVIDTQNTFLGIINAKKIAEVVEAEASEDMYRMASLSPIKTSYFDEDFLTLVKKRGTVLVILLLLQSFSSFILSNYQNILAGFLILYMGMITSAGGNTSGQVSVLVVQGFATGELKKTQIKSFLLREISIAFILGFLLFTVGFMRVYIVSKSISESIIVSLSLFLVVVISTLLGALIPFGLRKLSIDPAYSAGPLLATCMDIVGAVIFVAVASCLMHYVF